MLQFNKVSFAYHNVQKVFFDMTFDIDTNSFTCVIGLNGAGKTTLAKLAVGALTPQKGTIRYEGNPLSQIDIGYLPQKKIFSSGVPLSVYEYVLMGAMKSNKLFFSKEDKHRVLDAIARCGMEKNLHVPLQHLSGGQTQRASIARMLVSDPQYLVLDEPFDSLDIHASEDLRALLMSLRHKFTIIMISHNPEVISKLADKIICISNNDEHHNFVNYFFRDVDIPVTHICKH